MNNNFTTLIGRPELRWADNASDMVTRFRRIGPYPIAPAHPTLRLRPILAAALVLLVVARLTAAEPSADHAQRMRAGVELFKESVGPLLKARCIKCHGGEEIESDFDLSDRDALLASGHVAESAAESRLLVVIRHEDEPHMPPKSPQLSPAEIEKVARWIDLGAPYDAPLVDRQRTAAERGMQVTDADREFWSFRPLLDSAPPTPRNADWCENEIDRFILARQESLDLHPNPAADRRTLIRRVYFDLLGLPPTPAEVRQFVEDPQPAAYERLVDRLLDSRHYGERWARHWLDVARFGESYGFEHDDDRQYAYHYRDFLIRALNQDLPYDQFVHWQLAGDELAPDEPLALMATGFLGAGVFPTQLTEVEFESSRYDELDDMLSTTGVAFLGLSIGCARCHDHKYDPVPSRDYYRLLACFATTIRSEIELTIEPASAAAKVQVCSEGWPPIKNHADGRGYPYFYPDVYFLSRGDVEQKLGVAESGFLQVLMRPGVDEDHWRQDGPPNGTRTSFRRASLAHWMTDPQRGAGALAARVIVNRLWQHHFGRGLVATPNDFGRQGQPPTHPELLDWLASRLIADGWRLKPLHRLMTTCSTYRQSAEHDAARARLDPSNDLHWRRTPRRLEAEAIRDSLLSVAGLLDDAMYGPGSLDEGMVRRSIYFTVKRSQLIPMMMLFDWPEHLVSIGERATTTTAPQALWLMNNPRGRRYAESLADRLAPDVQPPDEKTEPVSAAEGRYADAVSQAYQLALGRPPEPEECAGALEFIAAQSRFHHAKEQDDAARMALVDFCQALLSMNEFVYVK